MSLFAQAKLPIVADPNFDKNALSPEMELWWERLLDAMNNPAEYPDPDKLAASNNTYVLGRQFADYIAALVAAFRATGDLKLLDEADRLMEIARGELRDTNGDGYLNWVWTQSTDPTYHNKDTHRMDEIMSHGNVALMAYALKSNADSGSRYAKHADFWIDYMENHWFAKWRDRGGIDVTLTHPFVNLMRLNYYMFKVTGKTAYLDDAKTRAARFADHVQTSPEVNTAFIWDHRISTTQQLGWQPVNYAHYVMVYVMELALEGFGNFSSDKYMANFASAWRDLVYTNGTSTMAEFIDGSGTRDFIFYNNAGLARWDETKNLLNLAERAYNARMIHVPAYVLMVLSNRDDKANDGSGNAPIAQITADIAAGTAPLTVHLKGSESYDPDGNIQSYEWDFGDGETSNRLDPPAHVYDKVGQYQVSLTVIDNTGKVGIDSIKISVQEPGTDHYMYFEAEDGDVNLPMQIGSDTDASGDTYIYTPAGTGSTTDPKPEATYQFDLAASGIYYLWIRTYAPSPLNDATYVGFNGQFTRIFVGKTNTYEWIKAGDTHNLPAGINQINICHGEEQARIDRISITTSPSFIPTTENLPTAAITLSDPPPTKAGLVHITVTTSHNVTHVPTPLIFTENDRTSTMVNLDGTVPGNTFTGILQVNNSIADGAGQFSLPTDALIDENGNKGNAITSGAGILIDKTPPSAPQNVQANLQPF